MKVPKLHAEAHHLPSLEFRSSSTDVPPWRDVSSTAATE
jgi:hypothetical protein